MLNETTESVRNTVHSNFFRLLQEKKISQRQYAKDNNISESTVSKWKSNDATMDVYQILAACEYLGVYPNDLLYSEDKRNEIDVLATGKYDPIKAKKKVLVKRLDKLVNGIGLFLGNSLLIAIFIAALVIAAYQMPDAYSFFIPPILGILLIPVIGYIYYLTSIDSEKEYTINYLDNIYYKINNTNNQQRLKSSLAIVFSIILNVATLLATIFIPVSFMYDNIPLYLIIGGLIVFEVVELIITPSSYKDKMNDFYIPDFNMSLINFYLTLTLAIFCSIACIDTIEYAWFYLFTLITPILGLLNVILIRNKYSEYKLLYKEYETKEVRELINED